AVWRWYAEVNDSVRQEVVERGWRGSERPTTNAIDTNDMPGMAPGFGTEPDDGIYYEDEVFDTDAGFEDVYGQAPEPEPIEIDQEIE
ncbi:hypothetical protein, partial [Jannaschia sp. AI_61]